MRETVIDRNSTRPTPAHPGPVHILPARSPKRHLLQMHKTHQGELSVFVGVLRRLASSASRRIF